MTHDKTQELLPHSSKKGYKKLLYDFYRVMFVSHGKRCPSFSAFVAK
jgi:hypothetical protein